jgi:hypothetical protein
LASIPKVDRKSKIEMFIFLGSPRSPARCYPAERRDHFGLTAAAGLAQNLALIVENQRRQANERKRLAGGACALQLEPG